MEQSMGEKNVMVVDDSSLARMLIRNIIGQSFQGWKVLEAKNAEEALVLMGGSSLNVALIDYNMPGMNGLDLAIKAMDSQPSLRVYLVTANIQGKMKERAEAAGVGFITKPVSVEKLQSAFASPE